MRAVREKEAVVKKVGRLRLPVQEKGAVWKRIFLGQNRRRDGYRENDHPLAPLFGVSGIERSYLEMNEMKLPR